MRFALGAREFEEIHQELELADSDWNTHAKQESVIAFIDELLAQAGPPIGSRILELGCGCGALTEALVRRGLAVTAIDISRTAVARAAKRAGDAGVELIVGDVADLPPAERVRLKASFDFVLDSLLMHCLIGELRKKFLETAHETLVPGGKLLVMTMCGKPRHALLKQHFDEATGTILRNGLAELTFRPAENIRTELEAVGFKIVYERTRIGCDSSGDEDMLLAVCELPNRM